MASKDIYLPTQLDPHNEAAFQKWYAERAGKWGLDPNPDNPEHFYDYRAAYRAGAEPSPEDGHWPSDYKLDGHPNMVVNGIHTRSGQPANDLMRTLLQKAQSIGPPRVPGRDQMKIGMVPMPTQRGMEAIGSLERILFGRSSPSQRSTAHTMKGLAQQYADMFKIKLLREGLESGQNLLNKGADWIAGNAPVSPDAPRVK